MEKKVSAAQIEQLYDFTRRHFVEHYDLQTELADHLANTIEQQWKQNPDISFEKALDAAFKEFGIFGFSDIVEQRRAALTKRYNRFIWKQVKTFFRLPKILLAIVATFTVYKLIQFSPLIFIGLLFPVFIISIRRMYLLNKKYKAKNKDTGKRWMLEEILYGFGGLGVALNGPLQMYIHIPEDMMAPWVTLLFSVVFVLFIIYDYVILYIVPAKAESLLEDTYPEYRLVKSS
jgi:hypothetical protein